MKWIAFGPAQVPWLVDTHLPNSISGFQETFDVYRIDTIDESISNVLFLILVSVNSFKVSLVPIFLIHACRNL